jgi:hypothetical protein
MTSSRAPDHALLRAPNKGVVPLSRCALDDPDNDVVPLRWFLEEVRGDSFHPRTGGLAVESSVD